MFLLNVRDTTLAKLSRARLSGIIICQGVGVIPAYRDG
jgi:hypothetical protein